MTTYQTLYRTFRPRTFSEMVGQDAIVRALSNQVRSKRIAHAYLFCGSRGTGKTSAARIMAMAINCLNPKDGDPCLVCENCKALASETTLDVFEMDAASNSRVEEIREMLSRTDYPPQFVPYKVYIIDEVHMLSNAAFNALLKTLEEPPPYMVFILATTEPQKLPATILSRCQRYDFGRIPESEIIKKLKVALTGEYKAEEEALRLIAASAQGAMRDAWSLMDMCLGSCNQLTEENVRHALGAVSQDFLFEFLDALIAFDTGLALNMIEKLMRDGRDVTVFLREFNAHIRQVLAVKWTGKGTQEMSKEQLERLKRQAASCDGQTLLFFLENCMRSEQDARWSTSQRAVLELLALRCGDHSTKGSTGVITPVRPAVPSSAGKNNQISRETVDTKADVVKNTREPEKQQANEAVDTKDFPTPNTQPEEGMEAFDSSAEITKDEAGDAAKGAFSEPEDAPAVPDQQPETERTQPLARTPKDAWNNLLKRLQREHPSLSSYINRGKYGGYDDHKKLFTLLMGDDDKFWISTLNDSERASTISDILSEEMGEKVSFAAKNKNEKTAAASMSETEQHIEELARVFGRDKIVLKND
ncbi:MAG: DNA polymerase III subunit gamma/tau [Bacillota bacterium]|nr:DNA polymerase III subunit gamma/tau [Bacillota bacterium]